MFTYYLSLNSGDLTNTPSKMCGSWYLPISLFRDGSLTLISMASLMVLAMLWSSLPTMLKLFQGPLTGHEVYVDNFCIVGREDQSMARTNREAMLIRVNDPSLNRDVGKYQLPHIWDGVLVKSPEFKLK